MSNTCAGRHEGGQHHLVRTGSIVTSAGCEKDNSGQILLTRTNSTNGNWKRMERTNSTLVAAPVPFMSAVKDVTRTRAKSCDITHTASYTNPPTGENTWNRTTLIGIEDRPPPSQCCAGKGVPFRNLEVQRVAAYPDPCSYSVKPLPYLKPTYNNRKSMFNARPRATDPMNGSRAALSLSGGHRLHDAIDPGVGTYDVTAVHIDRSRPRAHTVAPAMFNFHSKSARFTPRSVALSCLPTLCCCLAHQAAAHATSLTVCLCRDQHSYHFSDPTRDARQSRGVSKTPNMLTCGSTPGERPNLAHTLKKLPMLGDASWIHRPGPRESQALKDMFREVAGQWDNILFLDNEGMRYAGGLYKPTIGTI